MAGEEIFRKDTLGEYVNKYFKQDSSIKEGVKKGLADIKAGRIKSWDKIKKELRLETR